MGASDSKNTNLITQQITQYTDENGIVYNLDEKNFTASIIKSLQTNGDIFIKRINIQLLRLMEHHLNTIK